LVGDGSLRLRSNSLEMHDRTKLSGTFFRTGIILSAVLLLLSPAVAQNRSLKIRVLGSGQVGGMTVMTRWFTSEPSTDPLIIPTRESGDVTPEVIKRLMRLYFPRREEDLLTYDFFFFACIDATHFSGKQQIWIRNALDNHIKGGINTRSVQGKYDTEWRDSILDEPFPNDVEAVLSDPHYQHGKTGPMVIIDSPGVPDIMKPFKERVEPLFRAYTDAGPILIAIPKLGSVILSYTRNNAGIGYPIPGELAHVFFWRWNRSTTFTFRDMITSPFWAEGGTPPNVYAPDIVVNIIWYCTGHELPSDPYMVHQFRMDLYNFGLRKSLLASLLEFAEKFGALPTKEYDELNRIEGIRGDASQYYLASEYDRAYEELNKALLELEALEDDAMRLKDSTLFWVYVVEWATVTATLLFAGVVVWALMVRRSMYREVAATRSSMLLVFTR
jgi:hypothetical protein